MKMVICLAAFFILLIFSLYAAGGSVLPLIVLPGFIAIVPSTFLLAWAVSPKNAFSNVFSAIFKNKKLSESEESAALHYLKSGCIISINISIITFLAYSFITLSSLEEGVLVFGYHLSADINSLFYGVTLYLFFKVAHLYIIKK